MKQKTKKTISKRGGARKNSGPKPKFGKSMQRRTITLPDEQAAYFATLGQGNVSEGIRLAYVFATRFNEDSIRSADKIKRIA